MATTFPPQEMVDRFFGQTKDDLTNTFYFCVLNCISLDWCPRCGVNVDGFDEVPDNCVEVCNDYLYMTVGKLITRIGELQVMREYVSRFKPGRVSWTRSVFARLIRQSFPAFYDLKNHEVETAVDKLLLEIFAYDLQQRSEAGN